MMNHSDLGTHYVRFVPRQRARTKRDVRMFYWLAFILFIGTVYFTGLAALLD